MYVIKHKLLNVSVSPQVAKDKKMKLVDIIVLNEPLNTTNLKIYPVLKDEEKKLK
jgi:hypothetical protein